MGDLCIIGKVLRPYGLKGQICVKPITDFVNRFKKLKRVYVGDNPIEVEEHYIVSSFLHNEEVILKFKNINDRTAAESFSGKFIYIPEEELLPLPEGFYYVHDLIGLKVYDVNGRKIGVITDVWLLPANDVYVVESKGKEILIPAISEVVKKVDLENKMVIIEPMEGLIE
ncbi:MAG: ribosome maturation factor RimM [Candidatus Kryptonium sp.]|nr:ribosome maturation factor RimM [Candidatus Kryptonium sp.]